MRFYSKFAAVAAAASLYGFPTSAVALIHNMSIPSTAAIGSTVPVTLMVGNYITVMEQYGIIWGLVSPNRACDGCIGRRIAYTNLVGDHATQIGSTSNSMIDVPIPSDCSAGTYILVAGIPYLVGAAGVTGIKYYNATITLS